MMQIKAVGIICFLSHGPSNDHKYSFKLLFVFIIYCTKNTAKPSSASLIYYNDLCCTNAERLPQDEQRIEENLAFASELHICNYIRFNIMLKTWCS